MAFGLDLAKDEIRILTTEIEHVSIESHSHKDHHQLIYCVKGTLRIELEKMEYFLPEKHICMVPAENIHTLKSNNSMVKMFMIYFPKDDCPIEFTIITANSFILENLRYISKQHLSIKKSTRFDIYQFIIAFLKLSNAINNEKGSLKGLIIPKNERLQSILSYIKNNFAEDIKLNQTAVKFGFTERNLSRLFKKENLSFNNYLNYQRIISAIEHFSDNRDNIEEIGYLVGYKTPSNFSRTFKKFTGFSPRQFLDANTWNNIN